MAEELAKFAEVCMVGPSGSAALAPRNVVVIEARLKPLWRFLLGSQWQAWRQARRWRPDWIIAGSGLTAPLAWLAARGCKARTAVYLHGLDIALGNRLYRAIWLPAIRRMDRVIANSAATRQLALDAGVDSDRIGIVHPGVDIPEQTTGAQARQEFRCSHGLADATILLSIGRISERKGLREFVTDVLPRIVREQSKIMLLVIGDAPTQALYAKAQSRQSIQTAADRAGVGKNLRFLGVITDREQLAAAYRAADVHVFPVREIPGDPEGFGMVAVEAAAHGLATVAYATGGVVDAVAEDTSGHLVTEGGHAVFATAVLRTLAEQDAMRSSCIAFAQNSRGPRLARRSPRSCRYHVDSRFGVDTAMRRAEVRPCPATAKPGWESKCASAPYRASAPGIRARRRERQ